MKDRASLLGIVLSGSTTVLTIVSILLYKFTLIKTNNTYIMLVCAAGVGLLSLLIAIRIGKELPNFIVLIQTLLVMAGLGFSVAPMVNEIGLVYAGLNPQSNLTAYLIVVAFAAISWLIGLIATFTGITKRAI